jgi:hypothetical protein
MTIETSTELLKNLQQKRERLEKLATDAAKRWDFDTAQKYGDMATRVLAKMSKLTIAINKAQGIRYV